MSKLFDELMSDDKLQRAFQRASSNIFVDSRLACFTLALDMFRCVDMQGARHPLCLDRQARHAQCVAVRVAPEVLDRLHACQRVHEKDTSVCQEHETDVLRVVTQRTKQHADSIIFSNAERRGVMRCGIPEMARSSTEFRARLECLAPVVCSEEWSGMEKCYQSSNNVSASCFGKAVDLMTCLGQANSRLMFKQV